MKDPRLPNRPLRKPAPTIAKKNYVEQLQAALTQNLQGVALEPNGEALWERIRTAVTDHLMIEWKKGALLGSKPEQAFFVRCDRTTMTQNDIDAGRVICLVGVAPLKPAEFVIFQIDLRKD